MNSEEAKRASSAPEEKEPGIGLKLVPMWLVILFFVAFYWGQLYLDQHSGGFDVRVHEPFRNFAELDRMQPRVEMDPFLELGQQIFLNSCAVCHMAHGRGVPGQYPPVAGADWVREEGPERLIRILLHGANGLEVNGEMYPAFAMPPFSTLNDEQIAAVLSYIRNAWSNEAPWVDPGQVAEIRQAEGARDSWSHDELMGIPVSTGE